MRLFVLFSEPLQNRAVVLWNLKKTVHIFEPQWKYTSTQASVSLWARLEEDAAEEEKIKLYETVDCSTRV